MSLLVSSGVWSGQLAARLILGKDRDAASWALSLVSGGRTPRSRRWILVGDLARPERTRPDPTPSSAAPDQSDFAARYARSENRDLFDRVSRVLRRDEQVTVLSAAPSVCDPRHYSGRRYRLVSCDRPSMGSTTASGLPRAYPRVVYCYPDAILYFLISPSHSEKRILACRMKTYQENDIRYRMRMFSS